MIDKKMTLEFQSNGIQKTVHIKAGETSGARRLIVTLSNNGAVVPLEDMTVTCYIKDGSTVNLVTDCTEVEENNVIFSIPTLSAGEYLVELVVQDEEASQLYSPTFRILAEESLNTSASGQSEHNTAYIVVTDENFYTESEVDTLLAGKQKILTAGRNITLASDGTISAADNYYTAGENITISDQGVISATGGGQFVVVISKDGSSYESDVDFEELSVALAEGEMGIEIAILDESEGTAELYIPTKATYTVNEGEIASWIMTALSDATQTKVTVKQIIIASSELPAVTVNTTDASNYTAGTNISISAQGVISASVPSAGQIASGNTGYVTGGDAYTALSGKQNTLTAGTNITISNNVISAAGGGDAEDITYDNTDSGLTATDVQAAIDELASSSGGFVVSDTAPSDTGVLWIDPSDDTTFPAGANIGDLLVWNGTEWVARPKWQSVFQPVEYIESTGTQYINTKVKGANGVKLDMKIIGTPTNGNAYFGALDSNTSNRYDIVYYGNLYFSCGNGDSTSTRIVLSSINDRFVIEHGITDNDLKLDGTIIHSYSSFTNTSTREMTLFARNDTGTIGKGNARIYSCTISKNGEIVRDYVPVRNVITGEIGLYDKIEGVFYTNAGTGTFTKGADV